MALTVTNETRNVVGDLVLVTGTLTFDSSYPTGGEAVAASTFSNFIRLDFLGINAHTSVATKLAEWDRAAGTVILFVENGTTGIEAQAANSSDQSAVSVEFMAFGK